MDRSEFARLALQRVKAARPGDTVTLDEDKFVIIGTDADGHQSLTSLHNHYDE